MREIILKKRYPHSREEDITDAFMRGYEKGKADRPQVWILCSERLPSESGEYLVTYHPCYWDSVEDDIKVGIDTFRGKTTWAKKKYQKVIAWQPLPIPWEGDRQCVVL